MSMFVCALSLTVALLVDPPTVGTSPRQLYQAAANAIAQRELPQATELLEQLVQQHADWDMAEVAAYHLAECLWLQQKPLPALDVLAKWSRRIEQPAVDQPAVDQRAVDQPAVDQRAVDHARLVQLAANSASLRTRIVESLDDSADSRTLLEGLLTRTAAASSPQFTFAIADELSRRYQRAGDVQRAQAFLSQAISAHQTALGEQVAGSAAHDLLRSGEPGSTNRCLSALTAQLHTRQHFELPLTMAEQELSEGRAPRAIEILEQIDAEKLTSEQALAVRFLLAESLFAAGRHALANQQFQWLTEQAAELSPRPMWLAAIALRRGELLVRMRDIAAAQAWLLQAQRDHADFAQAHEFDYLLARCAVARIEFDEAQECLQRVIDAPTARATEAVPRASWMLGEVYFLQRQYAPALEAYATVARMDKFPEWQARALVQSAKCRELLGQTSQALAEYRTALQLSQHPEIQQSATKRVTALQGLPGELR